MKINRFWPKMAFVFFPTVLLTLALSPQMSAQAETGAAKKEAAKKEAAKKEAAKKEAAKKEAVVNVYSYRQSFLIKPLFEAFTAETGISVNSVFAKKGLVERIRNEGANSPVDLLITSDFGRIADALKADILQPVQDRQVEKNIPSRLRDPEGRWFALTKRARVIYASKERVAQGAVRSYDDLADERFSGRICSRAGTHDYNINLFAAIIAHKGEQKAEKWLMNLQANLARKPQGNDRAQVKAIYAGKCDIAIGNSYYFGRMKADPEQKKWADAVRIVFPDKKGPGVHINISGAGIAKNAPHKENALALLRFLSGEKAQAIYAEQNFEYPVKKGVKPSKEVASWGRFKADPISFDEIVKNRQLAFLLVNKVNFDGPLKK